MVATVCRPWSVIRIDLHKKVRMRTDVISETEAVCLQIPECGAIWWWQNYASEGGAWLPGDGAAAAAEDIGQGLKPGAPEGS